MKLLFICTHNRCRSILAEAVTNFYGQGVLTAKSAGSQPAGEVHPLTLKYLDEFGIPTAGLCSQSWDVHESWEPNIVITVCDSAAGEPCPLWFGQCAKVHWGLADPSRMAGEESAIRNAFVETIATLKNRIEKLTKFEIAKLDVIEFARICTEIGKS
jgi:arsenate reductase